MPVIGSVQVSILWSEVFDLWSFFSVDFPFVNGKVLAVEVNAKTHKQIDIKVYDPFIDLPTCLAFRAICGFQLVRFRGHVLLQG